MNLGNLSVTISANIQAFTNSIQQALAQVRGLGGGINNALGSGTQRNINNVSNGIQNMGMKFKDLDRIIGGIVVSQLFYQMLRDIKQATMSVIDFSAAMERAQIQFSYFLGNRQQARDFLEVMKDFAATTPFATDQAIRLATQLMNAGVAAKQVKSVMTILSDAASATGGTPEQMDRIVLALTQIKSQGFLAGQEIRQLANANIPIMQILKEQLGLTAEQLKDIGKIKIPGDIGMAAILKGLERFKGAGKEISNTWSGMWSNIRDDALIVSEKLFKKDFLGMESWVRRLRDTMEKAREALTEGGIGGVFEALVPKDLQPKMRIIIGSFQQLGAAMKIFGNAIGPLVKDVFAKFIGALATVLPIIAGVAKFIAEVASAALKAVPPLRWLAEGLIALLIAQAVSRAMLTLWSVLRLGSICIAVAQAVVTLRKAITGLLIVSTATPIGRVITIIAAAIAYLAISSGLAKKWLDALQQSLAGLMGVDTSKLLQPENQKSMQDMLNEFNGQLDHMNDNLKDVGKNAAAAGKNIKDTFVASFDEVFQIPDTLDKVGDDLGNIGDFTLPGLDTSLDTPDFPAGGGQAAGVPWWAKVPWWAVRPAGPGGPGGGNNGGGNDGGDNGGGGGGGDNNNPPPPNTAPVTGAIGTINDALQKMRQAAQPAFTTVSDGFDHTAASAAKVAGPVNDATVSLQGASEAAKQATQSFVDFNVTGTEHMSAWSTATSVIMGGWVLDQLKALGSWVKGGLDWFSNFETQTESGIYSWAVSTAGSFSAWYSGIEQTIAKWATESYQSMSTWIQQTGTDIGTWSIQKAQDIQTWADTTATTIGNWVQQRGTELANWATTTGTNFQTWKTAAVNNIQTWATNTGSAITTWVKQSAQDLYNWGTNTGTNMANWVNATTTNFGNFLDSVGNGIVNWVNGTSAAVSSWAQSVGGNIVAFANGANAAIQGWAGSSWNAFSNFFSGVAASASNWATSVISSIVTFAQNAWATIKSLASAVGKEIGNWFGGFSGSVANTYQGMAGWVSDNKSWLVPVGLGALAVAAIGATIATGGAAAPALLALETGGIVDKDQLVRIGEGNKREAVIPLENSAYMQPFSKAVANDLLSMLGGNNGTSNSSQPTMYVHTLIGDDRSLKELYRKMHVIELQENQRKGL